MSLNKSDFENREILVMGAGKSGIAAVKLLKKAGAVPVL